MAVVHLTLYFMQVFRARENCAVDRKKPSQQAGTRLGGSPGSVKWVEPGVGQTQKSSLGGFGHADFRGENRILNQKMTVILTHSSGTF